MKRIFTVEWDSIRDVRKVLEAVRVRDRELSRRGIRHFNPDDSVVLDVILRVWNTDISSLYTGRTLSSDRKFYVYAHLDPLKSVDVNMTPHQAFAGSIGMKYLPFYVGKGVGERCTELQRSETHRKIVQMLKAELMNVCVHKIESGLTEAEALAKESKLIDIFGLIVYGGWLTNLDEGLNSGERRKLYGVDVDLLLPAKDWKIAKIIDRSAARRRQGNRIGSHFLRPQEEAGLVDLLGEKVANSLLAKL